MINFLQDRDDGIHIIDYKSPTGNRFTPCGKFYEKTEFVNTFSLDNLCPGMCKSCYTAFSKSFKKWYEIPGAIKRLRGRLCEAVIEKISYRDNHRHANTIGRTWHKLTKYKRKLIRK